MYPLSNSRKCLLLSSGGRELDERIFGSDRWQERGDRWNGMVGGYRI